MIGGLTMDESELRLTIRFLLENISDHDLMKIAKKEKIGGVPGKINNTYKIFVINNLLNKKKIPKTIQILKKSKLISVDNNDSAKKLFENIFSNFLDNNMEENTDLISNFYKIKKRDKESKTIIDKNRKTSNNTNLVINSNVQLLQKKIESCSNEVTELSTKLKELKTKNSKLNKHIHEMSNQIIGYEKNELKLNKQIKSLKDSNTELAILKEANSKFYKKKINKLENEISQLQLKIDSINEDKDNNQINAKKLDYAPNTLVKEDKNRLLIQAPTDSKLRRDLRKSDIEIIESKLFSITKDDFGKVYNSVEEIPNILKYDISKYNYVYLYKDKLPIGDRNKLKSMFNKSIIREINDIKEILK